LAKHLQGVEVAGALWDVICKPSIRPRQLKPADRKLITSVGMYFDRQVSGVTQRYALDGKTENAELYESRLIADIAERPSRYFQRRSVPRLREELFAFAEELWQLSQEIRETRANNRHYRNSGACMAYNTPCQYLGICSGYDTPDSDKWSRAENVHSELEHIGGESRDILTNSRIRCFQTCRRKHYHQYEMGIKRTDATTSDALYFGSLFHRGLNSWWKRFIPRTGETDGNSSCKTTTSCETVA